MKYVVGVEIRGTVWESGRIDRSDKARQMEGQIQPVLDGLAEALQAILQRAIDLDVENGVA